MRSWAQAESNSRPSSAVTQVAMTNSVVTSSAIGAFAADPSIADDPSCLVLMSAYSTVLCQITYALFPAFVDAFTSRAALKRKTSKTIHKPGSARLSWLECPSGSRVAMRWKARQRHDQHRHHNQE